MKTATLITDDRTLQGSFRGDAQLFHLSPAMTVREFVPEEDAEVEILVRYVWVSAVPYTFDSRDPETYIFHATPEGMIASWRDLPGSMKGAMDIPEALRRAGYEIAE